MKAMLKFISVLSLLYISTTSISNAMDYYYCDCQTGASNQCVSGLDSNAGTSETSPRQSFSNARSRFSGMNGGDTIRFCRGGSFNAGNSSNWVNGNSTSTSPVTVTDYMPTGQTSLPRPIITKTSDAKMFDLNANGHQEGYVFSNLDLRCTACTLGGSSVGFFFYTDVDHVLVDNVSIDGFRTGVQMAEAQPTGSTLDGITLTNLSITNSKNIGLLGGANDLTIEDSYFENSGNGTIFQHNLYVSRGNNIVIRNNELYRSSMNNSDQCNGTSFVMHAKGILNGALIEGNIVREDIGKATTGCWGMSITTGYSTSEGFQNFIIRGNKIINVGNTGLGLTACQNCIIENNVILHEQAHKITAINVPDKGRGSEDQAMTNITIRNNSVYVSSSGTGIRLGTEGTQHKLVSNAIHYSGTGSFDCFNASLSNNSYAAYSEIANNVCYFPNASSNSEWENGSGTSPNPLAAWQGVSGKGANSSIINPGFTSPSLPQADFAPQSNTSGVVSAGHTTESAGTDFRGKTRDSQPDAGAYEYGTFNPPAKTELFIN